MLKDSEFQSEARKLGAVINPANGEEITALVQKVYAAPKQTIDQAVAELRKVAN
jgi:hypothetical protein